MVKHPYVLGFLSQIYLLIRITCYRSLLYFQDWRFTKSANIFVPSELPNQRNSAVFS